MMTPEEWERANARFLTDALAWLRRRLERYIAAMHGELERDGELTRDRDSELARDRESELMRNGEAGASESTKTAAKPKTKQGAASRGSVEPAKSAEPSKAARPSEHLPVDPSMNPPPALAILGQRFGLAPFELDVLLLCAGFELDTRIAGLCARAHDEPQRAYPTFALALTLFDDPSWDVTSLERPLRHRQLVEVERRAGLPLTLSPLHSDARTVDFVKGFNRLDERLATLAVPVHGASDAALPASQRALVERIMLAFSREPRNATSTIQLVGPDTDAKLLIARAASEQLARNAWHLKAAWLPAAPAEIDEIARLWQREAFLAPTLLILDAEHIEEDRETDVARATRRLISRLDMDLLFLARSAWPGIEDRSLALDVAAPTTREQLEAWQHTLEGIAGAAELAPQLASQFSLDLPAIERISAMVLGDPAVLGDPDGVHPAERLWRECCLALQPRLDTLAERIDAKATWDDLVLPPEQDEQLHQIAAHVRGRYIVYEEWGFAERMSRGLGISALFAGDSGTGKTMAAEVLANELHLPLYRIDLSAVVSKYIGETEKNLRRLFDAADSGGFILFFDEADALFGKRSEVRDSHDRYANIEVNYLLQRIEAYRGLAILASNAKAALDTAFVRRLRFIIDFPHPSPADRKRIWEKSFTAKTPLGPLDLDQLARLNATGGVIHNASLNAAFAATSNGASVTTQAVLRSLKAEYRKLNRPINDADFR